MNSTFLNLNIRDLIKGFTVTAITSLLSTLMQSLNSGQLPTLMEVKKAALLGLSAGIGYITTTFISNSQRQIFTPEKTGV